jgi:hypothetical protein
MRVASEQGEKGGQRDAHVVVLRLLTHVDEDGALLLQREHLCIVDGQRACSSGVSAR